MPIPFACPHCDLETLVDDEFAGQAGPCASCGKSIAVPYLPLGEPLAEDEVVVGIDSRGRKSIWVIGAVVVAAVFSGVAMIGVMMALLFPAVSTVRAVSQKHACDSNLARIGLALQAYETEHGTLPPAYIADKDGKPMHSWRVLLLPYLEQHSLYHQYDFNSPWDSAQNQALAAKMPAVYACPADSDAGPSDETSYLVVTGAGTLFPGAKPASTSQVRDDLASTIAVVEAPVSGVNWLNPKDLKVDNMLFEINGGFGREVGSFHEGGAHVLMADGTVRFLSDMTPADFVQGMTSRNGNEPIPLDVLEESMNVY